MSSRRTLGAARRSPRRLTALVDLYNAERIDLEDVLTISAWPAFARNRFLRGLASQRRCARTRGGRGTAAWRPAGPAAADGRAGRDADTATTSWRPRDPRMPWRAQPVDAIHVNHRVHVLAPDATREVARHAGTPARRSSSQRRPRSWQVLHCGRPRRRGVARRRWSRWRRRTMMVPNGRGARHAPCKRPGRDERPPICGAHAQGSTT